MAKKGMMTIRPARPDDLDGVHRIVVNAVRALEEQGIPQWDDIYPSREILERDIVGRHMQVIERRRRVVGFVTLDEVQSPEYAAVDWQYEGEPLVVHRLVVSPAYQRSGLASRLMNFAEQFAVTGGYDTIRLDAFAKNPAAIALYENRGYRKAGTVRFRKGSFYCYEKPVTEVGLGA